MRARGRCGGSRGLSRRRVLTGAGVRGRLLIHAGGARLLRGRGHSCVRVVCAAVSFVPLGKCPIWVRQELCGLCECRDARESRRRSGVEICALAEKGGIRRRRRTGESSKDVLNRGGVKHRQRPDGSVRGSREICAKRAKGNHCCAGSGNEMLAESMYVGGVGEVDSHSPGSFDALLPRYRSGTVASALSRGQR